jgi:hypothetical protein
MGDIGLKFKLRHDLGGCRKYQGNGAFQYFDRSVSSEGWSVQWELIPPGEESEPRSLSRTRGGNKAG